MPHSVVWRVLKGYFCRVSKKQKHFLNAHLKLIVCIHRLLYMCSLCYGERELLTGKNGCMFVDTAVRSFLGKEVELSLSDSGEIARALLSGLDDIPSVDPKTIAEYEKYMKRSALDKCHVPAWNGLAFKDILANNKKWLSARRERLLSALKGVDMSSARNLPPLVIILDEIHDLMATRDNESARVTLKRKSGEYESDMYCIVRGALRNHSFFWSFSLTITISTIADVAEFNMPPEFDPSFRPGVKFTLHAPIVLRHTFDVFQKGPIDSRYTRDWIKYLFSRIRLLSITSCGRPLWSVYLNPKIMVHDKHLGHDAQMVSFNALNTLILEIVMQKLGKSIQTRRGIGNNVTFHFKQFDLDMMTSILALSVALTKFPANVSQAELVLSVVWRCWILTPKSTALEDISAPKECLMVRPPL